jgi:hypothetical protein
VSARLHRPRYDPQRRPRRLPALAPAERRSFPARAPAVVAAIASLAEDYGLKDMSFDTTDHWSLYDPELSAWLEVTATAAGERTDVAVCVYPQPPTVEPPLERASVLLDDFLVPVGFFAVLYVLMIYPVVLLIALATVVVTFTALIVRHRLARRRHARASAAWGETWRRTFWPALEQRLLPTRLYR